MAMTKRNAPTLYCIIDHSTSPHMVVHIDGDRKGLAEMRERYILNHASSTRDEAGAVINGAVMLYALSPIVEMTKDNQTTS